MKRYVSFIDECGNTGTDLLEAKQKFFTLACVSVPEESADYLRSQVNTVFESLKEKDEKELKTRSWLKSKTKRDGMSKLLKELRLQEGFVTVVVVGKVWMLATLVVQNFLDPDYNTKALRYLGEQLFEPRSARMIVDYFYSVILKGDLSVIAAAFRKPTFESVKRAVDYLITITDNPVFKEILQDCNVKRVYEEDIANVSWAKAGVEYAPNVPAFADLGHRLANQLEKRQARIDVIFDHCGEFDETLNDLYEFCKSFRYVEEKDRIFGLNTWNGYIDKFDVANSKSEPLLLLADIVATGITKTIERILKGEILDDFNRAIFEVMRDAGSQDSICLLLDSNNAQRIFAEIGN